MEISSNPALRAFRGMVAHFSKADFSETEFLRQQVAVIEAYVERFPSEERDIRALAWIEANAGQFRQQWQMQARAGRRHPHFTLWG
ncbi:hypothetical protein [Accumulibacter sp.]|uniref:hypothetical protein n=1 Tax=Accumulibacter sp. TaxID=2053492 RepID=UPI0025EDFD34|nr:hypothetical protein [Accumulibacter sp.]MCP5227122.1 hypothetical protein [Accumulibacter sp.]